MSHIISTTTAKPRHLPRSVAYWPTKLSGHPDHSSNVVLDLVPLDQGQGRKAKVVWSIRIPLVAPLKKKPDVP
jgi:hypothetical protein